MRQLALVVFVIVTCGACYSHNPAGGPHYYGSWVSQSVPVKPTEPLPKGEALGRPTFYEAFFDDHGRIVRFVEYANANMRSETTYTYRPDGSFEERNCHDGTLIVSVHAKGQEQSSNVVRGGCAAAK
jgi:hypothetical protein